MNTDTGQIYRTEDEIAAARNRGEPITMVSNNVAAAVERGQVEMGPRNGKVARRQEWQRRWYGVKA